MAKGQPKKQTKPVVGDVVKVIGYSLSNDRDMVYGVIFRMGGWHYPDATCICTVRGLGIDSEQAVLLSDVRVIRGGAATNIRRKHDKDFKDAK